MENERNYSIHEKISEWNSDLARGLVPNDVILALYVVLGILGNGVVIYVYKRKFKGKIADRYFVPVLAITDLSAATVCGSFGMALNMMQAKFDNNNLCKAWWFFAAFTTFMSIQLLLIIAVQRYLKVVKPLGRQMTTKLNRIALLSAFGISLLLSIPTPVLYGSVPFPNSDRDIVGRRCSKIKGENKTLSFIYGGIVGLVAITIIGALIGIYLRIGWTIFKHMKYGGKSMHVGGDEGESSTKVTSVEELKENSGKTINDPTPRPAHVEDDVPSANGAQKYILKDSVEHDKKKKQHQPDQHEKINKKIMHKFTLMFMLITCIFLICYVPKVIIMLMEALNPKFWEEFNDTDRAAMLFVYRMYIINNISNPFVYAFLDQKFRNELKKMWCCHRR